MSEAYAQSADRITKRAALLTEFSTQISDLVVQAQSWLAHIPARPEATVEIALADGRKLSLRFCYFRGRWALMYGVTQITEDCSSWQFVTDADVDTKALCLKALPKLLGEIEVAQRERADILGREYRECLSVAKSLGIVGEGK